MTKTLTEQQIRKIIENGTEKAAKVCEQKFYDKPKSLTEQWREGTLPRGGYYIKLLDGSIKQTDYDNISKTFDTEYFRYNVSVKEVLAGVPSYDEYKELVSNPDELPTEQVLNLQKMVEDECSRRCELETKCSQLEKKLAIATKALDKCQGFDFVQYALKEIEEVK